MTLFAEDASSDADALDVSVVIPSYAQPESLRRAVMSVLRQNFDPRRYELIVVDSSPDDSCRRVFDEVLNSAECKVQFLHKPPEGPAASRDLGWRAARGRIIAFMDSDCQAHPDWLLAGVKAFEDPAVGLVQGRTLPDPEQRVGVFTWYVCVTEETFIYECANIFYRRASIEAVNGFSREYFATDFAHARDPTEQSDLGRRKNRWKRLMAGEDLDLAWRVKRTGCKSTFAHDALVFHEVQPIPIRDWIWIRRQAAFPRLAKNFPEIRRSFFLRYFFDLHQALFVLGLTGLLATPWTWFGLLAWIPYVVRRAAEPTRSLRGPLRLARAAVYLLRDASTFLILATASLKARCLVL